MFRKVPASGPRSAKVMIVGEAPGATEEEKLIPFVGSAGYELDRMLGEAGISRSECYVTNICKYRPPNNELFHFFITSDVGKAGNRPVVNGLFPNEQVLEGLRELYQDIRELQPHIIIAFGNWPLWALSDCAELKSDKKHKGFKMPTGIGKWRGSLLPSVTLHDGAGTEPGKFPAKLLLAYHPAALLRVWEWRAITVHDLRRAYRESLFSEYNYRPNNFVVRPSFDQVMDWVNTIDFSNPTLLAVDIENRHSHIACIGLAKSKYEAICIPLMCTERSSGYWSREEEVAIIIRLKKLLQHPNIRIIGQNFVHDMQHIARWWGFTFPVFADTLLRQHALFPGTPKDLAYITSLYSDHYVYWKDEGKDWEAGMPEEQLWVYNCLDSSYTYEDYLGQEDALTAYDLHEQSRFLHDLFEPVFHMMLRGTLIDMKLRSDMGMRLLEAMQEREAWFTRIGGGMKIAKSKTAKPWYRSNQQLKTLFYEWMNLPKQYKRKTKEVTTDNEALERLIVVEPLIKPLLQKLQEYRSLGVFYNTFISAPLEWDNRIRCAYKIGGTETYRFSSAADAFGYGTNLQNIPKGTEE